MHIARRRKVARIGGAALAAAAAVVGLAAVPSQATANVTTSRLAGNDRFGTAAAVATNAYPSGADTVLIASGRSFPDALAGSALAARQAGPVLLTEPTSLPAATSGAIDTLKATKAVILGGTTAVSQAVETELAKKVTVSRVSGTNRYDTAAKIAAAIGAANIGSTGGGKAALIATGANFADALAGGALSAAGSGGVFPVLLVDSGVPAQTRSALTDLGIKQAIILGGTSAVSQAVADELQQITGNAPQRIAGNDRYATATAIATAETGTFGFSKSAVYLANGEVFADALAGGALGGKNKTPILLTPATSLAGATASYLTANKDTIATITAFGGTAAVSDATLEAAKAAAQGQQVSPATIAVSPADDVTQANGSSRTYTASGLSGAVDIALVQCEGVTDAGKFDNANDNSIADGTASGGSAPDQANTPASIQTVNGAPNLSGGAGGDYADDASPSNGTVTFVVAGPSSGTACVRPVVFTDANGDDALNGSASSPSTPTEAFGLGGETTFAPTEASSGSISSLTIRGVDDAGNSFIACNQVQTTCATYQYDSGDTFQGDATSASEFEEVASPGDGISGQYNPGGTSTFQLDDSAPAAPNLEVADINPNDGLVALNFNDSQTTSVTQYNVYRRPADDDEVNELGNLSCAAIDDDGSTEAGYDDLADFEQLEGESVEDGNDPVYSVNTAAPADGQGYCYYLTAVDEDQEGPPSNVDGAYNPSGA